MDQAKQSQPGSDRIPRGRERTLNRCRHRNMAGVRVIPRRADGTATLGGALTSQPLTGASAKCGSFSLPCARGVTAIRKRNAAKERSGMSFISNIQDLQCLLPGWKLK